MRQSLCVQDYSVGQTTLEQIFNQFAASQDNPEVEKVQLQMQNDKNSREKSFEVVPAFKRSNTDTGTLGFRKSSTTVYN